MSKRPTRKQQLAATIGFTELSSTDSEATRLFLEKAFEWRFQEVQMPQGRYLSYQSPEGNTLGIRSTQRAEAPSSMNYVKVDDLDESEERVLAAGATVVLPRTDIPGMGSFFWFKVPSGPLMACWQDASKSK